MGRTFNRRELYDLMWAQPARAVAASAGVSDVALAKACRRADIPVPPRGHWAKKKASRATIRPSLPPRFPGAPDEVVVGGRHDPYWGRNWKQDILNAPVPPVPVLPALLLPRVKGSKILSRSSS